MPRIAWIALLLAVVSPLSAGGPFRVLAFSTARHDLAHISFVNEANAWFPAQAAGHGFTYEATKDWGRLSAAGLKGVDVVLFLDTRPDDPAQRGAFQAYMESGGAWMGFHFAAFALTPSDYPENWPWYHETFLGSGQYVSNTWRPTVAVLKVEAPDHPSLRGLPGLIHASPNEWYRWEHDLRTNPDIRILLSIDPSSFPLGTGPKPQEIWHSGYYPVAWTNTKYRMVYVNMGHNDMDYEHPGPNHHIETLSKTFGSPEESQFILQSVLWLGKRLP